MIRAKLPNAAMKDSNQIFARASSQPAHGEGLVRRLFLRNHRLLACDLAHTMGGDWGRGRIGTRSGAEVRGSGGLEFGPRDHLTGQIDELIDGKWAGEEANGAIGVGGGI